MLTIFNKLVSFFLIGISIFSGTQALAFGSQAFGDTAVNNGVSSSVSGNWSGYVADSGSYSSIGGTWVIPSPENSLTSAADATWVGIGGIQSRDLIQSGTQAIVKNGNITYEAWYELLPRAQTIIPLKVNGGDSVTVSLVETSPNVWRLSFSDITTGKSYEKDLNYRSSHSSAEWVEEMPVAVTGRSAGYIPLDNFGTVHFTNGYTVESGSRETIESSSAHPITMATGSGLTALATPSSLIAADAFSISRTNAELAPAPQREVAYGNAGFGRRAFRQAFGGGGFGFMIPTQDGQVIVVTFR